MKISRLFTTFMAFFLTFGAQATINPTAIYTDKDGNTVNEWKDIPATDAPLHVDFEANATNLEPGASLVWHFRHVGAEGNSTVTRYEENTSYDFTESGDTEVALLVMLNDEPIDSTSIKVTIAESHLEMPNAFSPNDDKINDIYGAKGVNDSNADGHYKSIVDFHGYIFNRWGQKLFEWTDISTGWDGTYNGRPCKDGVYFVVVKARGADGREYNIRRDVNLIRRYNNLTNSTEGQE